MLSMENAFSREEFDARRADGTLRIAFVGMSNGGKSYRSRVLRDQEGFAWYSVDAEIQKELGFRDMSRISSWLGYPVGAAYAKRERRYLELEDRFTKAGAARTSAINTVLDTTGSVVHLPEGTLSALRARCLVVHLDVGDDSLAQMLEKFAAHPKPVAWCGFFSARPGGSRDDALRHSYPVLLAQRLARYRALARLSIPAETLRDAGGKETLDRIRAGLG